MPPVSPTKTSKEIHEGVHPVSGEKPPEKKVIIDSRQKDDILIFHQKTG